jgi:hypothetical protein
MTTRIEKDGSLIISELSVAATTIKHEDWDDGDEPALSVVMIAVRSRPFRIERELVADVGLHALARRFQRGWPPITGRSCWISRTSAPAGHQQSKQAKRPAASSPYRQPTVAATGRARSPASRVGH